MQGSMSTGTPDECGNTNVAFDATTYLLRLHALFLVIHGHTPDGKLLSRYLCPLSAQLLSRYLAGNETSFARTLLAGFLAGFLCMRALASAMPAHRRHWPPGGRTEKNQITSAARASNSPIARGRCVEENWTSRPKKFQILFCTLTAGPPFAPGVTARRSGFSWSNLSTAARIRRETARDLLSPTLSPVYSDHHRHPLQPAFHVAVLPSDPELWRQ